MPLKLGRDAVEWAGKRGITGKTLERLRVVSGSASLPGGTKPAIVFQYFSGGERVNYKARSLAGKEYKQEKGGKQQFYNLDSVLGGPLDVIYITEGEMDALSLVEAGIPLESVLSVPNGAPQNSTESPHLRQKYTYALEAVEIGLHGAKKYVLATDGDDAGRALRSDLVSILGAAKCWFLDWPTGIKDANEYLLEHGAEALREYVYTRAMPWPVVGLFRLTDIPEPPLLELWDAGFPEWKGKVKLAPTMLSVATGYPGHGKTQLFQQIWAQVARSEGVHVALMSAETGVLPHVRRNLRQAYWKMAEHVLTDGEKLTADRWIEENFTFIQHPNARPTFAWLMDMIEATAHRDGTRAICIDPWNKLEMDRGVQSETNWIGDCLDEMTDAARGLNVHIQILAHPAKPDAQGRKERPSPYSISGSAHWFNRPDAVYCIHRPKVVDKMGNRCTEANFYVDKSRFEELGYPGRFPLDFDLESKIFHPVLRDAPGVEE